MAGIIPATSNPSNKAPANKTIPPLMTNKNNPRVRIVMGSVKSVIIGLMNELIKPKTTPAMMADTKLVTMTPSKMFAAIKTANPFNKIETINRISRVVFKSDRLISRILRTLIQLLFQR